VALGLVIVLAAGCSGTTTPTKTPDSGGPGTPTQAPSATAAEPSASPDTFDQVIEFAAGSTDPADSDLGKLWAEVFAEIQIDDQDTYAAPPAVRSYVSGEAPPTTCTENDSARRWRENALYCPGDHVIAYDETWFRDMSERFSFFAPVSVLAHEWGHHVQSVLGIARFDIQPELQADCFSGLYLTASGFLPHGTDDFTTEQIAMQVTLSNWFEQGDELYADSEWTDVGTHGSPHQRIMAVSTGILSNLGYRQASPGMAAGVPWCLGYGEFQARDYVDIGPYAFLQMPGRDAAWDGSVYGIAADTRTSLETSDIALAWLPNLPVAGEGATRAQMEALWRLAYPNLTVVADLGDIGPNAPYGTAVAYFYNNTTTIDGAPHEESGAMALLSPSTGVGGLLLVVSREGLMPNEETPETLARAEEQVATLFQVLNRLCSPDETDDTSAENLDVTCLRDLQ
jgi:predicted metalloprotease